MDSYVVSIRRGVLALLVTVCLVVAVTTPPDAIASWAAGVLRWMGVA